MSWRQRADMSWWPCFYGNCRNGSDRGQHYCPDHLPTMRRWAVMAGGFTLAMCLVATVMVVLTVAKIAG